MNSKEKVLFYITAAFAAYNLYEIAIVLFDTNPNEINGVFDLLLPFVIIANLIWAIWKRNKMAYISLVLCIVSIVGVIVMLSNVTLTPF